MKFTKKNFNCLNNNKEFFLNNEFKYQYQLFSFNYTKYLLIFYYNKNVKTVIFR